MPIWTPVNPDPPEEIVRRLKQIDPSLNLKFVEYPTTESHIDGQRWWAVVLDWEPNDPRHRLIQLNQIGNAPFDVIGYLPLDCSVYDAHSYMVNFLLGKKTDPRVNRMLLRVDEFNRNVTDEVIEGAVDRASELVGPKLLENEGKSIPKVSQYTGKKS